MTTMFAGADWIKQNFNLDDMSPLGEAVANLLGDVFGGIYHLDTGMLKKVDWANSTWIEIKLKNKGLSTVDNYSLTLLVVLCHDRMLRLEIDGYQARGYLRMLFHQRYKRSGKIHERCPTIEGAIARIRRTHPEPLLPPPWVEYEDFKPFRELGRFKPTVVCLCGSTRFYDAFQRANYEETLAGKIVLSVGFYVHSEGQVHGEQVGCTPEQKRALDELHLRKIDLADEVYILNRGGYIGESTRRELEYARAMGKRVRFLEPDKVDTEISEESK